MSDWFLVMVQQLPPPGSMAVFMPADGACELMMTGDPRGTGCDHPGEIGLFRHACDAAAIARLKPLMAAAHAAVSAKEQAFRPGTLFLEFGLGEGGSHEVSAVSCALNQALPPTVAAFVPQVHALVRELQRHPHRTIAGTATATPGAGGAGIAVELVLRASGDAAVTIPNPAAATDEDGVGLSLFLREEPLPGKDAGMDAFAVRLRPGEVVQPPAPGARAGKPAKPAKTITLAPGAEVRLALSLHRQVKLGPGRYGGHVLVTTGGGGIADDQGIDGSLIASFAPFTI